MKKLEYRVTGEHGDKSGWINSNRLMDVAFIGDLPQLNQMEPGQTFVDCDGDIWECRETGK